MGVPHDELAVADVGAAALHDGVVKERGSPRRHVAHTGRLHVCSGHGGTLVRQGGTVGVVGTIVKGDDLNVGDRVAKQVGRRVRGQQCVKHDVRPVGRVAEHIEHVDATAVRKRKVVRARAADNVDSHNVLPNAGRLRQQAHAHRPSIRKRTHAHARGSRALHLGVHVVRQSTAHHAHVA